MKPKKMHLLIILFALAWVIVIAWGIIQSTIKLSKGKSSLSKTEATDAEIKRVIVKKPKEAGAKEKGKKEIEISLESLLQAQVVMARIFKAKAADFQDLLPVMGTIKGNKEIELRFEINGRAKEVLFREGDAIKKGQLLARLDPKESLLKVEYYKMRMLSAQAAYGATKKKLEVIEELYKAGGIIQAKLEEGRLECEKARLDFDTTVQELNLAQNELKKVILEAPMDGVIGAKSIEVGEFITPNKKVGVLMDVSEVLAEAGIIERDIDKILLRQKAEVYVDAYPEEKFNGVIDNIFPVVEGKSRTLTVQIKLSNPKGLLLPGMFCRANISLVELNNAIMIPTKAVIKVKGNIVVVPVVACGSFPPEEVEKGTQLGEVELRKVKIGYSNADYSQIVSGVNAGEFVVIESQQDLLDKMKVKVVGTEEMLE